MMWCFSSSLSGPVFERRGGELLGQRLTEQLQEAYATSSCVDLKTLSVIAGEQCWLLHVDVLVSHTPPPPPTLPLVSCQVLEVGGSLLDTVSIGVLAALQSSLLPKLTVIGEGEEMEIEVSDNPHDSTPVSAQGSPLVITLHQVSDGRGLCWSCDGVACMQIGGRYVVDCSVEEEFCSNSFLSFTINRAGHVLSTRMEGVGSIPYTKLASVIKVRVVCVCVCAL